MSVLDRDALEESPLADLHAIASELSIDGYRRLRKAELIDAILERQGGDRRRRNAAARADAERREPRRPSRRAPIRREAPEQSRPAPRPPRPRGGRSRTRVREAEPSGAAQARSDGAEDEAPATRQGRGRPRPRTARPRDRPGAADGRGPDDRPGARPSRRRTRREPARRTTLVEGVVELLPNGSGFVRVDPPEPSDDDVYVSAAQVKRCELVSGDRVAGPRRAPRRSERFASLVRIDTINGAPGLRAGRRRALRRSAGRVPGRALPARLRGSDAQGDRVADAVRAGLAGDDRRRRPGRQERGAAAPGRSRSRARRSSSCRVVLAGVRPEEISDWRRPARARRRGQLRRLGRRAGSRGRAGDRPGSADRRPRRPRRRPDRHARRAAPHAARKAMAAARNIVDGGSLTVIATAVARSAARPR